MFTRKDYLDGNCTHSEYYNQFVTDYTYGLVAGRFGIDVLREFSYDPNFNFNGIPLSNWDNLAHKISPSVFKQFGDCYSLAGAVCILKQTAKRLVEQFPEPLDNSED